MRDISGQLIKELVGRSTYVGRCLQFYVHDLKVGVLRTFRLSSAVASRVCRVKNCTRFCSRFGLLVRDTFNISKPL